MGPVGVWGHFLAIFSGGLAAPLQVPVEAPLEGDLVAVHEVLPGGIMISIALDFDASWIITAAENSAIILLSEEEFFVLVQSEMRCRSPKRKDRTVPQASYIEKYRLHR